jgi:hypothetical protein
VTGAAVAVWRRCDGEIEWLVFHRSHFDTDFAGDWAIGADFVLFHAEVAANAEVVLSWEHDAYRWLPLDEACALSLPRYVGDELACVAALIG